MRKCFWMCCEREKIIFPILSALLLVAEVMSLVMTECWWMAYFVYFHMLLSEFSKIQCVSGPWGHYQHSLSLSITPGLFHPAQAQTLTLAPWPISPHSKEAAAGSVSKSHSPALPEHGPCPARSTCRANAQPSLSLSPRRCLELGLPWCTWLPCSSWSSGMGRHCQAPLSHPHGQPQWFWTTGSVLTICYSVLMANLTKYVGKDKSW